MFGRHSDSRVDVAHYSSAAVALWVALAALGVVAVVVAADGQQIAVEARSTRIAVVAGADADVAAADTFGPVTAVHAGLPAILADQRDLCHSCFVVQ